MAPFFHFILATVLFILSNAQTVKPITARVRQGVGAYFFSLKFRAIEADVCGDSIAEIYIDENEIWRAKNNQYYDEGGLVCDWPHNDVNFDTLLPISIRISMTSGVEIYLTNLVTSLTPGTLFTSEQTICGGTVSPSTSPTIPPPTISTTTTTTSTTRATTTSTTTTGTTTRSTGAASSTTRSTVQTQADDVENGKIDIDEDVDATQNEEEVVQPANDANTTDNLWIIIVCILILILACVIGFFVYRRFFKSEHSAVKRSSTAEREDNDYWASKMKQLDTEARLSTGVPLEFDVDVEDQKRRGSV